MSGQVTHPQHASNSERQRKEVYYVTWLAARRGKVSMYAHLQPSSGNGHEV
jgi:hypothetical protein